MKPVNSTTANGLHSVFIILLLSISIFVRSQYCIPEYTTGTSHGDYIKGITVYNSGKNFVFKNLSSGSLVANGYSDYTHLNINLVQGASYQLVIDTGLRNNTFAAWIDFNNDKDYNDTLEKIGETTDGIIEFKIPDSAMLISTRFRVRGVYNATMIDPCNTYTYGECEDYSLTVLPLFSLVNDLKENGNMQPSSWVDYDNDGDYDLSFRGQIFANMQNDSFAWAPVNIPDITQNNGSWCDYNKDGKMDLLSSNYLNTYLFRNDSLNYYTDIIAGLITLKNSSVSWADFNNDGLMDFIISGDDAEGAKTKIFINKKNDLFEESGVFLFGNSNGQMVTGDYNNDSYVDILLEGSDIDGNHSCTVYRNNGKLDFTEINIPVRVVNGSCIDWNDMDEDGDLDILLTDNNSHVIYVNNGNDSFSYSGISFDSFLGGRCQWVDFDNDGDLDVFLSGHKSHLVDITKLYRNVNGIYTEITTGLPAVQDSRFSWADYDKDGDLDLFLSGYNQSSGYITHIYKNNINIPNPMNDPPANLISEIHGNASVKLLWNRASDTSSFSSYLSYNVIIGTKPGAMDIVSCNADIKTGCLKIPAWGNTCLDTFIIVQALEPGKYYWQVQSIDQSFGFSEFSHVDSFISKPPFEPIDTPLINEFNLYDIYMGDLDNDGSFECSAGLYKNYPDVHFKLYDNDGKGNFFVTANPGDSIYGTESNWADFDNDGDLDMATYGIHKNGSYRLYFYKNIGNLSFSIFQSFKTSTYRQPSAWSDLDNDGDLDFIICNYYTEFYENTPDSFFLQKLSLIDGNYVTSADLDNDMDNDLIISNVSGTFFYYNKGNLVFEANDSILPYRIFNSDFSDYNNDGKLDLLINAINLKLDKNKTILLKNNGDKSYTEVDRNLRAAVPLFSDFDNDNDPDIIIGGTSGNHQITKIYINEGADQFTDLNTDIIGSYQTYAIGDVNDDQNIDMVIKGLNPNHTVIYKNNYNYPSVSLSQPHNMVYDQYRKGVILQWDYTASGNNSQGNVSFNLRIGRTKGRCDIISPMSDPVTGYHHLPRMGNAQLNLGWRIDSLSPGTYYWSVQAIDLAYNGGPWSAEGSFIIKSIYSDFSASVACRGQSTVFDDLSTSSTGTIAGWKWDFGDGSSSVEQFPQHLYQNSDTFLVKLWSYSPEGDSASRLHYVYVKPGPVANFNVDPVCIGNVSVLENNSDTSKITVSSWLWDFGNGRTSQLRDKEFQTYTQSNLATLRIEATNGCSDADTQQVVIGEFPDATILLPSASYNPVFCEGDSSVLIVNEYNKNYTYIWKSYNIPITNDKDSMLVVKKDGNYSLTVINPDAGCEDHSDTYPFKVISTPSIPQITVNSGSLNLCPDDWLTLKVLNITKGFHYKWMVDGDTLPGINLPELSGYLEEGTYKVKTFLNECQSISDGITVTHKSAPDRPQILVNNGPELFIMSCDNLHAESYQWYKDGNIIPEATRNYYIVGKEEAAYSVEIKVDGKDCLIKSRDLLIPSLEVGIDAISYEEKIIRIIPNPNNGLFSIRFGPPRIKIKKCSISDISGKIVYLPEIEDIQEEYIIQVTHLAEGLYLLKVETEKGEITEKFIIKNKP